MHVHGRTGEACPVRGDTVREEASFAGFSLQYRPACRTGGKPPADRRTPKFPERTRREPEPLAPAAPGPTPSVNSTVSPRGNARSTEAFHGRRSRVPAPGSDGPAKRWGRAAGGAGTGGRRNGTYAFDPLPAVSMLASSCGFAGSTTGMAPVAVMLGGVSTEA